MPNTIDPAIQAAAVADPGEDKHGAEAIDPLRKEGDALRLPEPGVAHHGLYRQALEGLEVLGPQRFKDRRERERVALSIALHAAAIGLVRIDRVAVSDGGAGYFFADTQAVDPAMRGYLAHAEAVQARAQAPSSDVQWAQAEQRQTEQVQRDAQQRNQQEQERRDPPQRLL